MGFEIFASNDLRTNFNLLNNNISEINNQQKYYNNWISKYHKIFKDNTEFQIIEWNVRITKSLKEIFSSATFFVEAQFVLKNCFYNSYYYLMYYSLFHAMLSTLYLDDKENIDKLIDINHTKVLNCFTSNFCNGKQPIISFDARKHFEILKFFREYSTYSIPLNEFFMDEKDLKNPQSFLENDIKQCFQVTNLHSIILNNIFKKHYPIIKITYNNIYYLKQCFEKVNGKRHPFTGKFLLDPADKCTLSEMRRYGCELYGITMDLEHFFDEFHGYTFNDPLSNISKDNYYSISSQAFDLVLKTICW